MPLPADLFSRFNSTVNTPPASGGPLKSIFDWLHRPRPVTQAQPTIPPILQNLLKSPMFNGSQPQTQPQLPPTTWNYNMPFDLLRNIIKIPRPGPTQ